MRPSYGLCLMQEVYSVPAMIQANRIRQFVRDHYIDPARAEGHAEITIRAGDVHREMSLTNAMPAVCSAIGSSKFDEFAGVTRTALTGPTNGANVYFTFSPARSSVVAAGDGPMSRTSS